MQDFNAEKKENVLPIVFRYLIKNGLYKTAKKLQLESKIPFEDKQHPLYDHRLDKIVGFYHEYIQESQGQDKENEEIEEEGEGVSEGCSRSEEQEMKEQADIKMEDEGEIKQSIVKMKEGKENKNSLNISKAKSIGKKKKITKKVVKKPVKKVVKKIIKKAIKKAKKVVKTPIQIEKQEENIESESGVKEEIKESTPVTKIDTHTELLASQGLVTKKKITRKQKEEKLSAKRTKKQLNYQNFKEKSEANTLIDKTKVRAVVHSGFTRCANVKNVRIDLFDSLWKNKQKKGGEDQFGLLGFERLGHTKGKDFRKEKNKLKKREFQGSKVTFRNNLIDLD